MFHRRQCLLLFPVQILSLAGCRQLGCDTSLLQLQWPHVSSLCLYVPAAVLSAVVVADLVLLLRLLLPPADAVIEPTPQRVWPYLLLIAFAGMFALLGLRNLLILNWRCGQ